MSDAGETQSGVTHTIENHGYCLYVSLYLHVSCCTEENPAVPYHTIVELFTTLNSLLRVQLQLPTYQNSNEWLW